MCVLVCFKLKIIQMCLIQGTHRDLTCHIFQKVDSNRAVVFAHFVSFFRPLFPPKICTHWNTIGGLRQLKHTNKHHWYLAMSMSWKRSMIGSQFQLALVECISHFNFDMVGPQFVTTGERFATTFAVYNLSCAPAFKQLQATMQERFQRLGPQLTAWNMGFEKVCDAQHFGGNAAEFRRYATLTSHEDNQSIPKLDGNVKRQQDSSSCHRTHSTALIYKLS